MCVCRQGGSAEKAHANVAKWTRRVDIFSKDFLFVPICEQLHWTLAIICLPAGIELIDDLSINFRKRSEEFCSILYMDSMGNFMKKALVSLTGCQTTRCHEDYPHPSLPVLRM